MKKAIVFFIAFALVLAGCTQQAAIVKQAVVNDVDVTSAESLVTLKVDTNLVDGEDETFQPILDTLKDGVKFQSKQKSSTESYTQVSLVHPETLTNTDFWPYEEEPTVDLFVDGDSLFLTSSIDEAALALPQEGLEDVNEEELSNLVKEFIEGFDYELKQASLEGSETITFVDGSTLDAQKVNVKLDLEESVEMLIYTLERLAEYPGAEELFFFGGLESSFQEDLQIAIDELQAIDIQALKDSGLNQELDINLWVADGHLVQVDADLNIEFPGELIEVDTEQVYVNVSMNQQTWNHDQEIQYELPTMDSVVTEAQLLENPELAELFAPESPVGLLAQMLAFGASEGAWDDFSELAFDDVPEGHWAYDYVTTLRAFEIIDGVGDNKFAPKKAVTRSEFAKMVVESLGFEEAAVELDFEDADQIKPWAEAYLQIAVANGILEGYEDGTLRPNNNITRSEMLTILVRALDLPIQEDFELTYTDSSNIQPYAIDYVKTGTALGLVQGRPDNSFAPIATTSRADAATVMYRILFELELEGQVEVTEDEAVAQE